jgi:hypothetical protein
LNVVEAVAEPPLVVAVAVYVPETVLVGTSRDTEKVPDALVVDDTYPDCGDVLIVTTSG